MQTSVSLGWASCKDSSGKYNNGQKFQTSKGAPQVLLKLVDGAGGIDAATKKKVETDVTELGKRGTQSHDLLGETQGTHFESETELWHRRVTVLASTTVSEKYSTACFPMHAQKKITSMPNCIGFKSMVWVHHNVFVIITLCCFPYFFLD